MKKLILTSLILMMTQNAVAAQFHGCFCSYNYTQNSVLTGTYNYKLSSIYVATDGAHQISILTEGNTWSESDSAKYCTAVHLSLQKSGVCPAVDN